MNTFATGLLPFLNDQYLNAELLYYRQWPGIMPTCVAKRASSASIRLHAWTAASLSITRILCAAAGDKSPCYSMYLPPPLGAGERLATQRLRFHSELTFHEAT